MKSISQIRNPASLDKITSSGEAVRNPLSAPTMKVLIQNPLTFSYLQAPGQWTSDINAALTFKDSKSAFLFCDQHGLYDLQVTLKFPDGRHDVEIPVLTGLPGGRQSTSYERFQATAAP